MNIARFGSYEVSCQENIPYIGVALILSFENFSIDGELLDRKYGEIDRIRLKGLFQVMNLKIFVEVDPKAEDVHKIVARIAGIDFIILVFFTIFLFYSYYYLLK